MSRPVFAGLSLFSMIFNEPLAAVKARGRDLVIHAVDSSGIPDLEGRRTTCDSVCGKQVRLIPILVTTTEGMESQACALFPPYVKELRDSGGERCQECWEKTGRMRPRMRLSWKGSKVG